MTYPGSRNHLWVPGERVDDVVLNAWAPWSTAWGFVAVGVGNPTNSGIAGTIVDATGVSVAITALAGRRYEIEVLGHYRVTATPGVAEYGIAQIRDNANNVLDSYHLPIDTSGFNPGWRSWTMKAFAAPPSGAITFKVGAFINGAGTGRLAFGGSWWINVVDVGPNNP